MSDLPKYVAVLRTSAEAEILELRTSFDGWDYYVSALRTNKLIDAIGFAKKLNKESK